MTVCIVAFIAAACGGGGGGVSLPPPSPSPTPTPTPTPSPEVPSRGVEMRKAVYPPGERRNPGYRPEEGGHRHV